MPVFTYEQIMEAARKTEIEETRRNEERRATLAMTPEERARTARQIVSECPSLLKTIRAIPGLQRNTLHRVVCALADGYTEIHIGLSGAWSARTANGASVHAYEKLDYHSGCREFLEAMRAAGVPIVEHGYKVKL